MADLLRTAQDQGLAEEEIRGVTDELRTRGAVARAGLTTAPIFYTLEGYTDDFG